jgi:hypothetical protein
VGDILPAVMPADDWKYVVPVVDALVSAGKMTVSGGFRPSQGGRDCPKRDPFDLAILRPLVVADPRAGTSTFASTGLDYLHCWSGLCSIAADPQVKVVSTRNRLPRSDQFADAVDIDESAS